MSEKATLSSHHELSPNYILGSLCSVLLSMNFKVTLLGTFSDQCNFWPSL